MTINPPYGLYDGLLPEEVEAVIDDLSDLITLSGDPALEIIGRLLTILPPAVQQAAARDLGFEDVST